MVKKRKNAIRRGKGDWLFSSIVNFLLFVALALCAYPLIFVLSASLSDPIAVNLGKVVLFPVDLSFEGYAMIFEYQDIWIGYRNTLFYTFAGTALNVSATMTAAYALSRRDLCGRNVFTFFFAFTMFFSGGLVPQFILVRSLGMVNTIWPMLLLGMVSMWYVIITRTYLSTSIPYEVQESACLDGCTDFGIFFRVILPLSLPIIAVISLYYAVGRWNSYFNAMIYLTDRGLYPLQIFLREVLIQNQIADIVTGDTDAAAAAAITTAAARNRIKQVMKFGVIVVASLPVLMAYPFLQRYFIKGIMIGAIKG